MNPLASSDYCLKWNDHHNVFFSTAEELCGSNILCDVSLSTGDRIFQAHKLVLSVCSPYFKKICAMSDRTMNTFIHLKNVDSRHLELILAYMYRGELTLKQTELVQFLATAKDLQIKGLSEMDQVDSSPIKDMCIKPEPRYTKSFLSAREPVFVACRSITKDCSDLKHPKHSKPSSYMPSHMTALPPPSTSSSGLMHHAAHHSPLHPSLSEAPPSPHHPAATSLPQPLHNHTASLASLAQHLKREIEGLALPQMSPTHRGLDEGAALKSGVGRRHDGGGALMVDDPGFHEEEELSNLSASDVQPVRYTNTINNRNIPPARNISKYEELSSSDDHYHHRSGSKYDDNSAIDRHTEDTNDKPENLEINKQTHVASATTGGGRKKSTNSQQPPTSGNNSNTGSTTTGGGGGSKAFQCGMCEMSFDQNWLLKRHFRTHTKERPFRCMLCMKNFSLKDSCIRHIRNVHRGEIYGEATVTDLSSSYCQFDVAGVGGSVGEKEDLDTEMNSNEALAVAL